MKTNQSYRYLNAMLILGAFMLGCAEDGKSGEEGINCGDHGSAHGDHCHCNEGYLFDGETCVLPKDISIICAEPEEEEVDAGTSEEHHEHTACQCPESDTCHCHGEIVTIGGINYCAPELHDA